MGQVSRRPIRALNGLALAGAVLMVDASASGSVGRADLPELTPPARAAMAMAVDINQDVVMFGGGRGTEYVGDTWTWDGSTWNSRSPFTSPEPRCCFQMAYDAARGQVVLFGGYGPLGSFEDTWTWDGSTWTEQHPATNPPFASNYGMAYDARRRKIVMFMGYGLGADQVWEWDGNDWTEVVPATQPVWRELEGAAYDGARRRVMMFGGQTCPESCAGFDDTWAWNGVEWIERHPVTSPSKRSGVGMGYDAARQRVVMFGGVLFGGSGGVTDETWMWDGRTWTLKHPASSPPARHRMGLAWDRARRQILMFGGEGGSFPLADFADTWVWNGFDWTCMSGCA